jgi:hypothetical protein
LSDTDRSGQEGGLFRFSVAHFLAALVVLLVTVPFVDDLPYGDLIEAGLFTVMVLAAVTAVGGRRRNLLAAAILVAPALVGRWLSHVHPIPAVHLMTLVVSLLFIAFVIVHLFLFILRSPQVDSEVLCAGIATYLLMGVFWGFAHMLTNQLVPRSYVFAGDTDFRHVMTRFEALYFSFITLTTVGYGDIMPASRAARMLTVLEATTGMFYVTVLIGRLVALYSTEERK